MSNLLIIEDDELLRDGIDDRVQGLNAGADDCLAKPFDMAELQARLNVAVGK